MNWSPVLPAILLGIATLISLPLASHAWRRREVPGAWALAFMGLGVALWSAGVAGVLLASHPGSRRFCMAIQYAGTAMVPPAWWRFCLRFTGRTARPGRALQWAATGVAFAMFGLVFTSDRHHWVWTPVHGTEDPRTEPTLVYWVFVTYCYLLSVAGCTVVAQETLSRAPAYRHQRLIMLAAGLVPTATSIINELGGFPQSPIDPTPFAFLVSVVLIWIGLFQLQLLDLVPVAQAAVLDSMTDGMLVLDARNRILDLNRSAENLLKGLSRRAIGENVLNLLPGWSRVTGATAAGGLGILPPSPDGPNPTSVLEVRDTPLPGPRGETQGRVYTFRDVTDAHQTQAERERLVQRLQLALGEVKTLTGLLPICASCNKIRDGQGIWHPLDIYLTSHTDAQPTHGLCPECIPHYFPGVQLPEK